MSTLIPSNMSLLMSTICNLCCFLHQPSKSTQVLRCDDAFECAMTDDLFEAHLEPKHTCHHCNQVRKSSAGEKKQHRRVRDQHLLERSCLRSSGSPSFVTEVTGLMAQNLLGTTFLGWRWISQTNTRHVKADTSISGCVHLHIQSLAMELVGGRGFRDCGVTCQTAGDHHAQIDEA